MKNQLQENELQQVAGGCEDEPFKPSPFNVGDRVFYVNDPNMEIGIVENCRFLSDKWMYYVQFENIYSKEYSEWELRKSPW